MDPAPPPGPFEPVSLGYSCETKYQLSRALYFRRFPDGDEHESRRMMLTPDLGEGIFQRHVFDWQITPFEAVLAYLEQDFAGVYERADLAAADDGSGEVTHRRLGTRHPHDFHPVDGVLDARVIDDQYEAARGKFEHLAARFRRLLQTPGDFLYVFKQIRIFDDAVRLLRLLRAGHPDHRCTLLFVDFEGEDQCLDALKGQVFRGWTPRTPDKPPGRAWEGDDAAWARILAPFALRQPSTGHMARTLEESLAGGPA